MSILLEVDYIDPAGDFASIVFHKNVIDRKVIAKGISETRVIGASKHIVNSEVEASLFPSLSSISAPVRGNVFGGQVGAIPQVDSTFTCDTPRVPLRVSQVSIPSRMPDASHFELPTTDLLPHTKKADKTGEPPLNYLAPKPFELYLRMPQTSDLAYKSEATFYTSLFLLVKHGWLDPCDDDTTDAKAILSMMNPEYEAIITNVPKLMKVDFSELFLPRLDYAEQTKISPHRVELMNAMAVHYDLNFGLVMRAMGGETTASWRNVKEVLNSCRAHVSEQDLEDIERILTKGCPAEFNWEEPAENKEAFIRRGNNPTVTAHCPHVLKTLNKEERNSHVMCFSRWLCRASPYARVNGQTLIPGDEEKGKKWRLVWDGTTKCYWYELTMNEVTPTRREPEITFGFAYMMFCIWIWNLRISFPNEEILLAFIDISSCFRFPRMAPDLCGAFGFMVGPWFFAANAMVFGSVASASSWEPFRRAIAAIALACFFRKRLVQTHKKLLDMIKWADPPGPDVTFAPARSCVMNQGVFNADGTEKPSQHNIYVDDNLMADIRRRMPHTIASAVEAIFTVMGVPMLHLRQSAVAMDKWQRLLVAHELVLLGFLFNTRTMTVGITDEYRQEVLDLLDTVWAARDSFTINEIEKLVGKLGRIAQAYRPLYHLMPQLYASVAYALRENAFYLATTSRSFRKMIKKAKSAARAEHTDDAREINFAIRQVAKKTHSANVRYRIPPTLKKEIELVKRLLRDSSISLSTFIGHIVPRKEDIEAGADSSKTAGGGWCVDLLFWWHAVYPEDIYKRACLPNNRYGDYVSINVLEMVCVIINFAGVIYFCELDGVDMSTHPLLNNWCDNKSACAWVNTHCKHSLIGRELGKLFVGLLMGTQLGIQAEWLPSKLNKIADDISRLSDDDGEYDYSQLLVDHPSLNKCRQFQPSDTLLGMIWDILRHKDSPDPLIVRELRPLALGSIISSGL